MENKGGRKKHGMVDIDRTSFDCADTFAFLREDCAAGDTRWLWSVWADIVRTWSVGLHLKAPFIDRVAKKVTLKEQVVDFAPQPVITKDNVTMRIDTVVFFQITDPKLFAYGVENPIMAIENLTATTLRNIIGDLELDQTLTSRETINTKMRASLDVATDPMGHQGQPCGAEEHHSAGSDPGCHGEADEGRA